MDRIPPLGESVFDSELREVGSIVNVLGPVSYPMVEVRAKKETNPPGEAAFYLLE